MRDELRSVLIGLDLLSACTQKSTKVRDDAFEVVAMIIDGHNSYRTLVTISVLNDSARLSLTDRIFQNR